MLSFKNFIKKRCLQRESEDRKSAEELIKIINQQNTKDEKDTSIEKDKPTSSLTEAAQPKQTTSSSSAAISVKIEQNKLKRFLEIQPQIEEYEKLRVYDTIKLGEEELEALEKSKKKAEISERILGEQTRKEKQDFENLSQPGNKAMFKSEEEYEKAKSKEEVRKRRKKLSSFYLFFIFINRKITRIHLTCCRKPSISLRIPHKNAC